MPDLWKALGDVYGDADARPVHREPAADDRSPQPSVVVPLDDDLAAALSAALVEGPSPAPEAAPPPPVAAPPAPAPPPAPVAPVVAAAPAPSPAPVPAPAPPVVAPTPLPVAPTPPPEAEIPIVPVEGAQEKISTWLADIDARQKLREQGPPVEAIEAVGSAWRRGDDDILPARAAKRDRRKR